jgi:hypothetical protein
MGARISPSCQTTLRPAMTLWMLEDANPGGLFRVTPKPPASK